MNKKLILSLLVFAGFLGSSFAVDDISQASLSLGISFPQIYNLNTASDDIDSEKYSAWGINFAGRTVLSGPGFGLFVDGNFYFPYSHKITIGDTEYSYSMNGSSRWGVEGLIGIYGVLINTGRFVVPLGIGPHFNYVKTSSDDDADRTQSAFSFGLGGWANAELSVTDTVTLYGGIRLDYDFYQRLTYKYKTTLPTATGVTATTKQTKTGTVSNLFVIPVVGAIFRF